MEVHQKAYKIASILLQYPTDIWLSNIHAIETEVNKVAHPSMTTHFNHFIDYVKSNPLLTLCERYVETFDYHGIVTLHLTYNVFKDSRKRGEALIELQRLYKKVDLEKTYAELPDYLPLILEFLAIVESE